MNTIQEYLDSQVAARNCDSELCAERPDPLMIARLYRDPHHALTCALFAYGNVKAIIAFIASLDIGLQKLSEDELRFQVKNKYYRFQKNEDVVQWFLTLQKLIAMGGAERVFMRGYRTGGVIEGLSALIDTLYTLNPYRSQGYEFLIGKPIQSVAKASAMKRWMMYLRWMVRKDELDMGLWKGINPSDLIMPLDTHTYNVSRRLGLLGRKQCDLKAAMELTETLRQFDPLDPLKYDFALYRIGQEKIF